MRRTILALTAALLAAAGLAGVAGAQTYVVIRTPDALPSAEVPNPPGSVQVSFAFSRPPAQPAVLSYEELLDLWRRAGAAYGIPWQVLGAINKIESNFGQNMGPSSAGALGWMQFIPSSWERWGLDADGDRVADPWDPDDAIYAAARYLAAAGGREDLSRAVFAYNHAQWYVDEVLALAATFGDDNGFSLFGAGAGLFQVADYERRFAEARRQVTQARRSVPQAEYVAEQLEWKLAELEQRAGDPALSAREFSELDARIQALEVRRDRARARVDRRRAALDYAVTALDELRSQAAQSTALSSGAASLGGALANGDYVFPVGGGPGAVSVAHHHHDYPAADIAAPEGSPVYALADALVLDSFPDEAGRCGIGLKLQIASGAVYAYCHLAYLEPDVVPGAALGRGAVVGLVGSTGNSTGPHLHLGLVPSVAYPQDEPWFASFAGTAFSWQDARTPQPREAVAQASSSGRVFRVVMRSAGGSSGRVVTFTR